EPAGAAPLAPRAADRERGRDGGHEHAPPPRAGDELRRDLDAEAVRVRGESARHRGHHAAGGDDDEAAGATRDPARRLRDEREADPEDRHEVRQLALLAEAEVERRAVEEEVDLERQSE